MEYQCSVHNGDTIYRFHFFIAEVIFFFAANGESVHRILYLLFLVPRSLMARLLFCNEGKNNYLIKQPQQKRRGRDI